jgi:hypothetical protein
VLIAQSVAWGLSLYSSGLAYEKMLSGMISPAILAVLLDN